MWNINDAIGDETQLSNHSAILASLLAGMNIDEHLPCDIHLCFSGAPQLYLGGFLVTQRDDPDALIAYCPMQPWQSEKKGAWRKDLLRQFRIAMQIARCPQRAETAIDAIWLGVKGTADRRVPHWIYGLSCVPLRPDWDGNFVHPRPFCSALFERMATKEEAVKWLQRRPMNRFGSTMD